MGRERRPERSYRTLKLNQRRRELLKALGLAGLGFGLGMLTERAIAHPQIERYYLHKYSGVEPYSYTVFREGDMYYAKNGKTGEVFEDDDASEVMESAISSLPDTGGRIFIKSGDYRVSGNKTITLKSNVEIVGEGKETVLGSVDGRLTFKFDGVENVTLRNFTISNNDDPANLGNTLYFTTNPCSNIQLHNLDFEGSIYRAITIAIDVDNLTVEKCTSLSSNVYYFIYAVSYVRNSRIEACRIEDKQSSIYIRKAENLKVVKNWFINGANKDLMGCVHICNYETSSNIVISENHFIFDTTPTERVFCILLSGEASTDYLLKDVVVSNNAFHIKEGVGGEVGTNGVYYCVYLHGVSSPLTRTVEEVLITNNSMRGDGFLVRGVMISIARRIDVHNNTINGTQYECIKEEYGESVKIHNNILHDWDRSGGGYSAINAPNSIVRHNLGYPTENSGVATITGDGTTTTFTVDIPHGLAKDKVACKITLDRDGSIDKVYLVDTEPDGFYETIRVQVTYASAPASGEEVPIYWSAEVVE